MLRWIVDLFVDHYDGKQQHAAKLHITSLANSCRDAMDDAAFRVQEAMPAADVHVLSAASPDSSPYPDGFEEAQRVYWL
jgi:hypothetical protein